MQVDTHIVYVHKTHKNTDINIVLTSEESGEDIEINLSKLIFEFVINKIQMYTLLLHQY